MNGKRNEVKVEMKEMNMRNKDRIGYILILIL
jgi:hypothetical protein